MKTAILSGRLQPGDKLPSSRVLAKDAGVSRNTVLTAWDRLTAEGYLVARQGSGTLVRPDLPPGALPKETQIATRISRWAAQLGEVPAEYPEAPLPWDFRSTQPSAEEFPLALWRRLASRVWQDIRLQDFDYQDPAGRSELRESLVGHLALRRGVACRADQILIVSGAQQALDLIARVVVESGDVVAIEHPNYAGARLALSAVGAKVVQVPVDHEGLRVDLLPGKWRLVYTTPSHQYPTGVTLSLQRRLALIEQAQATGGLIIEDDYNSEFHYKGRPIPALHGLDPHGRVIYVGTFSKSLFPSLRLGYIVAPTGLVDPLTRAKWLTDQHAAVEPQLLLARLIADGHFDRYVRRMRARYEKKASLLAEGLAPIGDVISVPEPVQGLHVFCPISAALDPDRLVAAAKPVGVGLRWALGPDGPGLVMGFARLSEHQIEEGAKRVVAVVRGLLHADA